MGDLSSFVDITGNLSQDDINSENISNIIDEVNRNSDQLDSINNVLSVIAYGSLVYNWDGSGSGASPTVGQLIAPVESSASFIDMTYFSRSTDTPIQYLATPYTQAAENANGDSVVTKIFLAGSNSTTGQYEINLNFYATGTPTVFTFYYTILQQPANAPAA